LLFKIPDNIGALTGGIRRRNQNRR
jgi:hypothetical protein